MLGNVGILHTDIICAANCTRYWLLTLILNNVSGPKGRMQAFARVLLRTCLYVLPAAYMVGSCVRLSFLYKAGIAVCRRS